MVLMSYDLVIAYRVYPGIAKSPVFYPTDKRKLVELGLRSLRLALGESLRVRFLALLDGCPAEYESLVRRYFDPHHTDIFHLNRIGNAGTFLMQVALLLEQQYAEWVYFAEDDYLYRPGTFPALIEFASIYEDVHFVLPYDHPDFYTLPFHRGRWEIRHAAGHFWRTAASGCLTFLTRRSVLQKTASLFRTYQYGNFDASMWLALTKHGVCNLPHMLRAGLHSRLEAVIFAKAWLYGWRQILFRRRWKLWCPIPSMATHVERDTLAPGVDWEKVARLTEHAYGE